MHSVSTDKMMPFMHYSFAYNALGYTPPLSKAVIGHNTYCAQNAVLRGSERDFDDF